MLDLLTGLLKSICNRQSLADLPVNLNLIFIVFFFCLVKPFHFIIRINVDCFEKSGVKLVFRFKLLESLLVNEMQKIVVIEA
jgi:hypothetical protein